MTLAWSLDALLLVAGQELRTLSNMFGEVANQDQSMVEEG